MKKLLLASVALFGFAGVASAADLPARAAPPVPVVAAVPVFTWTGFYVGVNAGYGWNTNDTHRYYDPVLGYYGGGGSDGGFVGGAQVGYNYQIGSFVIGLETDIQYADIGGGNNNWYWGGYYRDSSNGNWFGTVRARAGVAFDRALIYVTGGLAYGDVANGSSSYYDPALAGFYYGSDNGTNTGWTLGGGVEYAFTNNLTAKVEGLYVNLDTKNNWYGVYGAKNNAEFGVVRAGLNYKFNSY